MKTNLDKKFDQHFKSSFEGFETLPSADSWKKISANLEKKPTKRPFVFWSAAASILLLMGVGIGLYIHPFAGVKPDVADPVLTAQNPQRDLKTETSRSDLTIAKNVVLKAAALAKADLKLEHQIGSSAKKEKDTEINTATEATETPENEVEGIMESGESLARIHPINNKISGVLEQELAEEMKQKTINGTESKLALTQAFNRQAANEKSSSRKIKLSSVGDLVNLVVAQVDKREDKIIRVSKTEEGENEITGINLGLFKFNKAEK